MGAALPAAREGVCLVLCLAQDALVTLSPSCPAPPLHTYCPGSSWVGTRKPDHFAVYMCLDPCVPELYPQGRRDERVRDG